MRSNMTSSERNLGSILLLLAAAALPVGCGQKNKFVPPPPPKVTVAPVTQKPVADYIDFTGTTAATATVELRARVRGYLEKILFTDGSNVKKGDLLFVIEQEPLKVALAQAKAEAKKADAALKLAEAEYIRAEELAERKAISKADLDARAAERDSAKATVDSTKAAVDQAQLNFNYSEIRAPIDGRIGRHLVDLGNLVDAEMTPLAKIESIDPIYAHFNLSERDLLRIMEMRRDNQLPDPDKYPPEVRLGLANEKGFPHAGKLDYRELGIDPKTGTALRRVILPNPVGTLIPGMFVRLRAQLGSPTPKFVVPDVAIATDQRVRRRPGEHRRIPSREAGNRRRRDARDRRGGVGGRSRHCQRIAAGPCQRAGRSAGGNPAGNRRRKRSGDEVGSRRGWEWKGRRFSARGRHSRQRIESRAGRTGQERLTAH
jgi:RND family efflux transporter MFP subunit